MKREYITTTVDGIALYHVSGGILCEKLDMPSCAVRIASYDADGRHLSYLPHVFRAALTLGPFGPGRRDVFTTHDVRILQSERAIVPRAAVRRRGFLLTAMTSLQFHVSPGAINYLHFARRAVEEE